MSTPCESSVPITDSALVMAAAGVFAAAGLRFLRDFTCYLSGSELIRIIVDSIPSIRPGPNVLSIMMLIRPLR